jgi:phage head maturation protease
MIIEKIGQYFRAFLDGGEVVTAKCSDFSDEKAFSDSLQQTGIKSITATKTFPIEEIKIVKSESGRTTLSGYANTKGKPDSYGDIPTNYQGNPVYVLDRFTKNPVMLMDHRNSLSAIMGRFLTLTEDARGLFFEAELMTNDEAKCDDIQHAISAYENGFARALSIGGRWTYADPNNPTHMTGAYIVEISGVAVPADEDALCNQGLKPKK